MDIYRDEVEALARRVSALRVELAEADASLAALSGPPRRRAPSWLSGVWVGLASAATLLAGGLGLAAVLAHDEPPSQVANADLLRPAMIDRRPVTPPPYFPVNYPAHAWLFAQPRCPIGMQAYYPPDSAMHRATWCTRPLPPGLPRSRD